MHGQNHIKFVYIYIYMDILGFYAILHILKPNQIKLETATQ